MTGKDSAAQQKNESEKEFTIQPIQDQAIDPKFGAFSAKPGPAVPQNMPEQEGTVEERQAKMAELNKKK